MRRRIVLASSAGLIGGLAGCSGILGGSRDDTSGPAAAVESFFDAVFEGDVERANELVHEDAPFGEVTSDQVEHLEGANPSVEETSVVSKEDGKAIVKVRIAATARSGERRTGRYAFDVRTQNGEWRIYEDVSYRVIDGGPSAPSVQWESTERTNDDGAVTAVAFVHGGGDDVDASTLSARADGATAGQPESNEVVDVGTELVVPLDGDGEPASTGSEVSLVWTENGNQQTLAVHTLTSETVGSIGDRIRVDS